MTNEQQEVLTRLKQSDDILINVDPVAAVLGCHPQDVRNKAQNGELGFKVWIVGNRVQIVRSSFLRWIEVM